MSLFQLTIKRDQDWDTMNQLFKCDYLHYQDINAHIQPHQLLFADYVKRCEDTNKRILYCEDMFKHYEVSMHAPPSLESMEQVLNVVQMNKRKAANQLLPEIESEMIKQERFVRDQHKLIDGSIKSFRSMIAQINVLNSVAKLMGVAPT